ncbi:hypothetical protein ACIGW7_38275 [Streptomyces sp. NPDC053253]|uniref:hypothetical protein n=1 Tax=Streptomyces sp. NPDC053253 TaxID=3365699 RepID=UPI0037CF156B
MKPRVDTALAAVDVAAIVYTVRRVFNRHHILAEARRHLLETRGRAFDPGLDTCIADQALARHSRRLTAAQQGSPDPAPELLNYTGDFAWPTRWWIARADMACAGEARCPARSGSSTTGPPPFPLRLYVRVACTSRTACGW